MSLNIWKQRINILQNDKYMGVLEKIEQNPNSIIMELARLTMIPHQTIQNIIVLLKKADFVTTSKFGREVRVNINKEVYEASKEVLNSP